MDLSDASVPRDPLFLTPEETDLLHRVACRLVESAARQTSTSMDEFPLGRLCDYSLAGVFVTLRKNGELRGCIGNFAAATPLGKALAQAATGVVSRDARFPAVAPEELPELALSVSLLHTREILDDDPAVRVGQVVIGKHGLDIQYQGHKGLLLPSVATDFGLDPLGFLQAVCRKANLPDDAWRESGATLYRFSAIVLGGPWTAD
jgi:AmmeMemoRadiSam system protein A